MTASDGPGGEGEAGSLVAVVSLPGRRAAGGRPQAGLEFVEKLLTMKLDSVGMTERNASMLRLTPRPVMVAELATGSCCAWSWSSSPLSRSSSTQLLGRYLD